MELKKFVELFNKYFYLCITQIILKEESKNNNYLVNGETKDNLYLFYNLYDLRF